MHFLYSTTDSVQLFCILFCFISSVCFNLDFVSHIFRLHSSCCLNSVNISAKSASVFSVPNLCFLWLWIKQVHCNCVAPDVGTRSHATRSTHWLHIILVYFLISNYILRFWIDIFRSIRITLFSDHISNPLDATISIPFCKVNWFIFFENLIAYVNNRRLSSSVHTRMQIFQIIFNL